jgi:hypothetical protein
MKENTFDPNNSVKTIEEALNQAKAEKTGASFYYKVWGLLLFIYYFLNYIQLSFPDLKWLIIKNMLWIVFPIGGFISFVRNKRDTKRETFISHFEKIYLFGFGGFALTYGTICISTIHTQPLLPVLLYPILLGFTVFVIGGITGHSPSIIGGIAGIICTGIGFYTPVEGNYLLAALASIFSCFLPGILMRNRNV